MDPIRHLTNCRVFSNVRQEDDEEAWKIARNKGIGGSDIGPIMGVSPFTSARQVYLQKTGQYPVEFEPGKAAQERMRFGHLLEPVVAQEFARRTGMQIVPANATLVHKDYNWAFANVDRLIVDNDGVPYGVLEVKTASEYQKDEWDEGEIMLTYIYQLQWYLFVTGLKVGHFAALVGGNKFFTYEVQRDDELIQKLLVATSDFWYNNVLKLVDPPMQQSDTEFANKVYSNVVNGSELISTDSLIDELAHTIVECKRDIKLLEKTMEQAQNQIKDLMKENEILYTSGHIVKWSPRKQTRLDTDALKADYPDLYDKYPKTVEFRVMTIKEAV